MFRALSDQLYGHDGKHAILRRQVCDHIAARESAYAGFVDTERPFADYVRAMRERGTYGGHMELTAFARLKRRSIKVILPDVSSDDRVWVGQKLTKSDCSAST